MTAPLTYGEHEIRKYVRFCEKFLDDGNGGPWTIKGREYVLDEIWRPMMGYRLVQAPHTDIDELCTACRERFWSIELDYRHTPPPGHRASCEGLVRKPIIATILNIPRRNAKTHSVLSFLAARCFLKSNQRWAFLAAAEDQADELLDNKLVRPLSRHPGNSAVDWDIRDMFTTSGTKLEVPSRNSWIEVLASSHASITGRGNTGVAADECRDLKARVPAAVMATIYDAHGWECPKCFRQWMGEDGPATCPRDGQALERWFGRIVFASSSGVIEDDDERDWFGNLVKARVAQPVPEAHVFTTGKIINPSVSTEIVDASMSIAAGVPGFEDLVAVEASNMSLRRGEIYLKAEDVRLVVDKKGTLADACESDRAAVWFLDTSDKADITTLAVIVDDAGPKESPFERIALGHLKIWDPNDDEQCPTGVIDDEEIERYLAVVHERFTRLRRRRVDTRGRPWAIAMVTRIRKKAWGRQVDPYEGKQVDDDAGFEALHDYVLEKRILIPRPLKDDGKAIFPGMDPHARLLRELVALKKVERRYGGIGVEDPNADHRGRNKRKKGIHRDAAASLAGAALLAWEERKKLAGAIDNAKVHEANARGRTSALRSRRTGGGFFSEQS